MNTLWDMRQTDAFVADVADTLVAGFELRVSSHSLAAYSQREFDDVEARVKRVLAHFVDVRSDEWDHFNGRMILKRGREEVIRHLLERINTSSLDRCRAMRPEDWRGGSKDTPPRPELSPEEQRAVHEKTVRDMAEIRARFEGVLKTFEDVLALTDQAWAAKAEAMEDARYARFLNRPAPAPEQQRYGVSARGAELLVRDWMRHLGILSAEVTQERSDGGVDVVSDTHVAQVKNYKGNVSVVEIRELFGVATSLRKRSLFFTSGGFTAEGLRLADALEIPLIRYTAEHGLLAGINDHGKTLVADGFDPAQDHAGSSL